MSETRAQYGDGGEAREQQQAQHTPGPWKVRVDDYHGGMTVTDESGRSCVAMFPRYWLAHDEANAAMIAAAPDLLNIAKRVVNALEDLEDAPPPRYRTRWHDLRDDARAAINHAAPAAQTTEADHDGR